jgi:glycosyltransferase involved in cell wall biosynthesis
MLSIIVPCYNEEESLPLFVKEVEKIAVNIEHQLEYIFVNDGSKDQTLQVLRKLHKEIPDKIRYISFSKNFGKEAGLYAGLQAAKGDLITVMDADLQDPPELLPKMIKMLEDSDIDCVGTRRADRHGEPPIRSFFAKMFYRLVNKFGDTEMVDGARDFRLMTRQMVDAILEVTEYNRFSKGIFSSVLKQNIFLMKIVNVWLARHHGLFGAYLNIR